MFKGLDLSNSYTDKHVVWSEAGTSKWRQIAVLNAILEDSIEWMLPSVTLLVENSNIASAK